MTTKPRIGLLGVGWIGRSRMEAILATGAVEVAAVVAPSDEMAAAALVLAPGAARRWAGMLAKRPVGLPPQQGPIGSCRSTSPIG